MCARRHDEKSGAATSSRRGRVRWPHECLPRRNRLVPLAGLEPARCFHHLILSQVKSTVSYCNISHNKPEKFVCVRDCVNFCPFRAPPNGSSKARRRLCDFTLPYAAAASIPQYGRICRQAHKRSIADLGGLLAPAPLVRPLASSAAMTQFMHSALHACELRLDGVRRSTDASERVSNAFWVLSFGCLRPAIVDPACIPFRTAERFTC
jgi:hypothetical protein